jgi:hypothetical protein
MLGDACASSKVMQLCEHEIGSDEKFVRDTFARSFEGAAMTFQAWDPESETITTFGDI